MSGYSSIGQQTSPLPLVVGSNPSAASYFSHHHPTIEQTSKFESLLQQIAQLSPQERDAQFIID